MIATMKAAKLVVPILIPIVVALFSANALAASGAVRCGKLIDVRSGRTLRDQIVSFDDNGKITSVAAFSVASAAAEGNAIDL